MEMRIDKLRMENERLKEALEFYAHPDTYFAISFMSEPPCGEFMDDFDIPSEEWSDHDNALGIYRAGKRARAALKEPQ
jgi:hypothetical protein